MNAALASSQTSLTLRLVAAVSVQTRAARGNHCGPEVSGRLESRPTTSQVMGVRVRAAAASAADPAQRTAAAPSATNPSRIRLTTFMHLFLVRADDPRARAYDCLSGGQPRAM